MDHEYTITDITNTDALEMRGTFEEARPVRPVGRSGQYEAQDIIIKTAGGSLMVEFFGNAIPRNADEFAAGEDVILRFQIRQHEYEGRFYTKLSGKQLLRANAPADAADDADADGPMPF